MENQMIEHIPDNAIQIKPKPGVCFKTQNTEHGKDIKVFINICTHENVI